MKRLTVTLSMWRGKEGDHHEVITRDADRIVVDRDEDRLKAIGYGPDGREYLWAVYVNDCESAIVDTLPEETNAA